MIKKGQISNGLVIAVTVVSTLVIVGSVLWSTNTLKQELKNIARTNPRVPTPQQPPQRQHQVPRQEARIDMNRIKEVPEYRIKGDPNAPVTIVEFSDFQCPFCGRWTRQTYPALEKYIKEGKVKLVFKHLPLPFHRYAQKAAEAAECAGKIGGKEKFWAMHDKIFFEGQPQGKLDVESLKQFAKEIGLNEKRFSQCLDTGETAELVRQDYAEASQLGVRGTPTFFINGRIVRGAQPTFVFERIIQEELERAQGS